MKLIHKTNLNPTMKLKLLAYPKAKKTLVSLILVEILVFAPHSRLFSFHKPVTHLTVRTLFCSN